MTIYLDRGPFLTIPDKLHPGQYRVIRNPDWHGELPEIVSFTDFLKWNYTLEYGRHIRELHYYRQLPLPWGVPREADIETVIIEEPSQSLSVPRNSSIWTVMLSSTVTGISARNTASLWA